MKRNGEFSLNGKIMRNWIDYKKKKKILMDCWHVIELDTRNWIDFKERIDYKEWIDYNELMNYKEGWGYMEWNRLQGILVRLNQILSVL